MFFLHFADDLSICVRCFSFVVAWLLYSRLCGELQAWCLAPPVFSQFGGALLFSLLFINILLNFQQTSYEIYVEMP